MRIRASEFGVIRTTVLTAGSTITPVLVLPLPSTMVGRIHWRGRPPVLLRCRQRRDALAKRFGNGIQYSHADLGHRSLAISRRQSADLNIGGEHACIVALDKKTGEEIWKAQDDPAHIRPPSLFTSWQAGARGLDGRGSCWVESGRWHALLARRYKAVSHGHRHCYADGRGKSLVCFIVL